MDDGAGAKRYSDAGLVVRVGALEDTVEFFNLVLGTKLEAREKEALVHYMRAL